MTGWPLHLPTDNRRLSGAEIAKARRIIGEIARAIAERDELCRVGAIDAAFALPDANWLMGRDGEPSEVGKLVARVMRGDETDLNYLRALGSYFTGYSLFEQSRTPQIPSSALTFSVEYLTATRRRLEERNDFVEEWPARLAGAPHRFVASPPPLLGEVGHIMDGAIVNHDTCAYQERVTIMRLSGLTRWLDKRTERTGRLRVCEIGGGYGALAYWFKRAFPNCSYTIIDLPESLLFSRVYIALTRPDVAEMMSPREVPLGFSFVPNHQSHDVSGPFDLVINTLSMSEMSAHQVAVYVDLIREWLKTGGLFFEQNQDNRKAGLLFAREHIVQRLPYQISLADISVRRGFPSVWSMQPFDLAA